jgi:putative transposase
VRVRYGYRRLHILLKREGWSEGRSLIYRLYREEGLGLRSKRPRRHVSALHRERPIRKVNAPNEGWSLDFVSDQLGNGLRLRALTVVDVYTRECLAIDAGQHLTGVDVVRSLQRICQRRGNPKLLFCDNGAEFTSHVVDLWAYQNGVRIDFSRPGKPTDNAYVESFNGRLRDECLNTHWFESLDDARAKLEAWKCEYNDSRPHRALNNLTPSEFAARAASEVRKIA